MQIVCRNDFSLILTEKGKLYSFGYSKRGALGRNRALLEYAEPGLVEGLDNQKITKLRAGSDFIIGKTFSNENSSLE
jgi:alpha-tubulin suppressor-like RCC1 family protein